MTKQKNLHYAKRLGLLSSLFALYALIAWAAWTQVREVLAYNLPTKTLRFDDIKPRSSVEVLDRDGKVIDYWWAKQNRIYVPIAQIDAKLVDFVILLEDAKFFGHHGFDVAEIKNSIEKNLEHGKVKRGASTITQQLAKNLFLDKDRSLTRKIFEIPWALRIEKDLSKKQILELYLNTIEWGPGIYGVEAAARHFLDRPAAQLEVGQALYLALIVPGPKRFDLFANPKMEEFLTKKKQDFVNRLVDEKRIAPELKASYLASPFGLVAPDTPERHYPPSHEGTYAGNRGQKEDWLKALEKNFAASNKGRVFKTTISKALQDKLQLLPEMQSEERRTARYIVLSKDDTVAAFRKVSAHETLPEEQLDAWKYEGFEVDERPTFVMKSLLLR